MGFRKLLFGLVFGAAAALEPDSAYAQRATPQPFQTMNVVPITITGVIARGGELFATGVAGGTAFETPVTLDTTPSLTPGACPILNLQLGPINLSLLGLNVDTSPICLDVTAHAGQGLLGDLLCGISTLLRHSARDDPGGSHNRTTDEVVRRPDVRTESGGVHPAQRVAIADWCKLQHSQSGVGSRGSDPTRIAGRAGQLFGWSGHTGYHRDARLGTTGRPAVRAFECIEQSHTTPCDSSADRRVDRIAPSVTFSTRDSGTSCDAPESHGSISRL
jgi:hypothetical protein